MHQCEYCKNSPCRFSIHHSSDKCPFMIGRFCVHCSVYGHGSEQCDFKPPIYLQKPQYIEQLISPTQLIQRKINTLTPLKHIIEETTIRPKKKIVSVIILKYRLETMKEFLKTRGVPLKACRTKEPMRKLVEAYASEHELNIKFT